MPAIPRIRRSPFDPDEVFRTDKPIPVIAGLRWNTKNGWGEPRDVEALALAWTPTAVEIQWTYEDQIRLDWIDANEVRRP